MFRRRTSLDSDAATLAQRRLAALAEHLAPARVPGGEVPDETSLSTRPTAPAGGVGRHRGRPRASELGQWSVSRQHVVVAAVAAALLVLLAAWWFLRAVPHGDPVRLASSRSVPAHAPSTSLDVAAAVPPTAASPVGAPVTTAGTVVVDVAGKVRRPGIVELPVGSRVVDALEAAGGARPGVDPSNLNLARVLVDGEQIVVGGASAPAGMPPPALAPTPSTATTVAPVDINTASQEQLESLPDVGPVTAQSIIDYRTENGSFTTVDQLLDVSGIGEATLADLRPYVYV